VGLVGMGLGLGALGMVGMGLVSMGLGLCSGRLGWVRGARC
jgi:hypothetical protein